MWTTADIIGYLIIVILFVLTAYWEAKHFICDSLTCDMYKWAGDKARNDRDFYLKLIDGQTRQSVWMRSYYMAVIITAFSYCWIRGRLPHILEFIALLVVVFFVVYFGLTFYQHHQLGPINDDLKDYIVESCNTVDQRKEPYNKSVLVNGRSVL